LQQIDILEGELWLCTKSHDLGWITIPTIIERAKHSSKVFLASKDFDHLEKMSVSSSQPVRMQIVAVEQVAVVIVLADNQISLRDMSNEKDRAMSIAS
jgi:hypothetical protein